MTDNLRALSRETIKRAKSDKAWRGLIRAARDDGYSFRAIAEAAGVSHVAVQKILRAP